MKTFFLPLLLLCIQASAQSFPAPLPAAKNDPVLIAHRGDHTSVPENSVAAIEAAIRCGVDYVELDLRTTRDGFLVLCHNASVDHMTNGKGNVKDLTLAQIRALRVKATDSTDTHEYHIAEFREALAACRHRMNIYLDFKDADVPQTLAQIREADMEKNVVVYLNHPSQYGQWRAAAPTIPLMATLPDAITTVEQLDAFFSSTPIEIIDNIPPAAVQSALRKKGVAVWVDVQSRTEGPQSWNEAMARGVQGLQTDHPEALVAYLRSRNQHAEPAR